MKNGDDPSNSFILGFKNLTEFSNEGLRRVTEATRAFQTLPPPGPLWDLQKTMPEFARAMKNSRTRILPIMKTLLEHVQISTTDFKRRDMEEKLDFIIEANDDVLERIGSCLDEAEGLFKRAEVVVVNKSSRKPSPAWNKRKGGRLDQGDDLRDQGVDISEQSLLVTLDGGRRVKKAVHRVRVTEKPQLKFKTPVDNSVAPFIPKLSFKPNSLKPLAVLPHFTATNEEYYAHPYELELSRWEPTEAMLQSVEAHQWLPLQDTPLSFVSTCEELDQMMVELEGVEELAVDVEHHSFRSYLGLTCLLQISTRTKDYVVDTLALRDDLELLNQIFTKPTVVKVFHGASSDIEWLQRDLGLYVVGLFDTYLAMKQLGFQQFSLQALLQHYCQLELDKRFQLADWRLRPIPDDLLDYARRDTHFLLYAYDRLKQDLIQSGNQRNNLLNSVFLHSQTLAARRYEKPGANAQLALRKTRRRLNNRQVQAFADLYKWRDEVGREKDESPGFVLPNHMLLTIAETLPKEMTGILACCDPVPQMVHLNLGHVHRIVLQARDLPLHEDKSLDGTAEKRKKPKSWMVLMNSIHDMGEENQLEGSSAGRKSGDGQTWPEIYKAPEGWTELRVTSQASFPFGRARCAGRSATGLGSSPFDRYQKSNEILEALRKPESERGLDMADPLVRVVLDTIVPEPTQDQPLSSTTEAQIYTPAKVLDNTDFVAFNPMGGRRAGGVSRESVAAEDDDWGKDTGGVTPFLPVSNQKNKRKKNKKPKFLDKVKNFALSLGGKKRKRNKEGAQDEESGRSEEAEEPVGKKVRMESGRGRGGRGRGTREGRGGKGRDGFLNPFRKREAEGRSMTFK